MSSNTEAMPTIAIPNADAQLYNHDLAPTITLSWPAGPSLVACADPSGHDESLYSSSTIGLRRIPMPPISTSIVSPGFIHSGGF
jgi:hypothetical protein